MPVGYYVTRISGGASTAACGTSPTTLVTAGPCIDTVPPGAEAGPFSYSVTAVHSTWTATAASAGTVTIVAQGLDLGIAATFSVLGSAVTSGGVTLIAGDVGTSPGAAVTTTASTVVGGTVFAGGTTADAAQVALATAYAAALARTPTSHFAADQNGVTFGPGVHQTAAAFELTGILRLDAQGDPNAIFIFQVDGALNTAAGSSVQLIGGAQASHVFWQVNGGVGTGAASTFVGTLLVVGAITIGAAGTLTGRALATGAITLADNIIRFTDTP